MNDCVFCKIISGEFSSYKVYEDDNTLAFLSIEPESFGHTLVIPKNHYKDYEEIPVEVLNNINETGKNVYEKIKNNLKPNGIRLVQNNGSIQEVKHFHLHIIPVFNNKKDGEKDFEEVLKEIKGE